MSYTEENRRRDREQANDDRFDKAIELLESIAASLSKLVSNDIDRNVEARRKERGF
jgi:hypothetical protein